MQPTKLHALGSKRNGETEKNYLFASTRNCSVSYETLCMVSVWAPTGQRSNSLVKWYLKEKGKREKTLKERKSIEEPKRTWRRETIAT